MTESGEFSNRKLKQTLHLRCCAGLAALLLLLLIMILILAYTVFRTKDPQTHLVSITVDGISPRVSFPARIKLNVTLNLEILVHNPNLASFKFGSGKSLVFYSEEKVGEADLTPGRIPVDGSVKLNSQLTLQAEKLVANGNFITDMIAGAIQVQTMTTIPGTVTIFGILKHHAVAVIECQITIGFPDLAIRRQDCEHKTKL